MNIFDQESHMAVYRALVDHDGEQAAMRIKVHIKGITSRIINLEKDWLATAAK